jgi:hypothetical protein
MLVGAAIAIGGTAGCNIVAPAYWLVHGGEKIDAEFKLPKDRSTVVFIDDRANRIPRRALRVAIAEETEKSLIKNAGLKDMISAQSALQAAGRESGTSPVPVTEIAQRVHADIIVYATVDTFTLSSDTATYRPMAALRVKVLDAKAETRLWPKDETGYTLTTTLQPKQGEKPTNTGDVYKAEDELARQVGVELAQLFFKHDAPTGIKPAE